MCGIDGCKKRAFGGSFTTGVSICINHISIRKRYYLFTDKVSLKIFKKYWGKAPHLLKTPPSKRVHNRRDCEHYEYLEDSEIKKLLRGI